MVRKATVRIELDSVARQESCNGSLESLSEISHDIRSSINIIVGYTQLMLEETTGKINAQQRQALKDISNSTNRLQGLTDILSERLKTELEKK